jgi:hypothetical protein
VCFIAFLHLADIGIELFLLLLYGGGPYHQLMVLEGANAPFSHRVFGRHLGCGMREVV